MISQKEAKDYYENMYKSGSIYVWGFNSGTAITEKSIANAYRTFASSKYNKAYYDSKLREGLGKNGSDCSGSHFILSGYDTTAQGYYNRCTKKGSITSIPKHKLVLVFKGSSSSSITHTGVYLGNGNAFHMKSSTANAVLEPLEKHGWKWWGYADFISDYDTFSFDIDAWDNISWIKTLQSAIGVKSDGVFDEKSLAATVVLSKEKNSKHASVKPLQTKLDHLGFNCGTVDGIYGNKTYVAVRSFQKAKKLTIDGKVGKNTWSKLVQSYI